MAEDTGMERYDCPAEYLYDDGTAVMVTSVGTPKVVHLHAPAGYFRQKFISSRVGEKPELPRREVDNAILLTSLVCVYSVHLATTDPVNLRYEAEGQHNYVLKNPEDALNKALTARTPGISTGQLGFPDPSFNPGDFTM